MIRHPRVRTIPFEHGDSRPGLGDTTSCQIESQVYHVSRESFLYLSEFYIGEVAPEDRPLVPVLEVSAPVRSTGLLHARHPTMVQC